MLELSLLPPPDQKELYLSWVQVMPHGICILAAATIPHASLKTLHLSGCVMDADSLHVLLPALLQRQTLTSLDVSNQRLGAAGVHA